MINNIKIFIYSFYSTNELMERTWYVIDHVTELGVDEAKKRTMVYKAAYERKKLRKEENLDKLEFVFGKLARIIGDHIC